MSEIWKVINNYPDYQISNFGRVKSFKREREKILKPGTDTKGYLYIILRNNKKSYPKRINILVYETFYNDKLKLDECVHHKDENSKNNYYKNLKKMTKFDHSSFHNKGKCNQMFGKHFLGEKSGSYKLLTQEIIQIKLLLKEGKLIQQEIADIFDVTKSIISRIKLKKYGRIYV